MPQSLLELANQIEQENKNKSLLTIADEIERERNSFTPFDPKKDIKLNAFGKTIDPVIQAGKTGALRILDLVGRPQQALFGLTEGLKGAKKGFLGEKRYSGEDVLNKAGFWTGSDFGKKAIGLGLDIGADPVNLAGIGSIAKGLSKTVDVGTKFTKTLPGVRAVAKFVDPHADLESVKGLKEFARLSESESRAIRAKVHEDVANAVSQSSLGFGSLTKSLDEKSLEKIAYAMDKGDINALTDLEQGVAKNAKKLLDDQWNSEVLSGHQSVPLKTGTIKGKQPVNLPPTVVGEKGPAPRIADYVPYVTKPATQRNVSIISDVRGTSRFSEPRSYKTLEEAVTKANADPNLANILQARLTTGRMAQLGTRVVEDALERFGSKIAQPGWRELNTKFVKLPEAFQDAAKGTYFDPKVADYLERSHAIFTKSDDVKNSWQKAVKVYKSWLVTNPQQAATNLLGNTINAYMTGNVPSVKNMALSAKVVAGGAVPSIGKYSSQEIRDAMRRWEIVGGAGQFQDVVHAGKNYSWNPLKADFILPRGSQFVNQHFVEEPFKVAQFLENLDKGSDLETAALKVKDTFFDYAEISDGAKFLRDNGLVPFITWQLKNIPLQIDTLLKRPQKFAQTESVYSAITDDETIVPHQDVREGLLPINGTTMRFANPIHDLNKIPFLGDYEPRDFAVDTLGQMAPWFKAAIEVPFNERIYNAQPIAREGEGAIPFDAISMLMEKLGLGKAVGIGEDELGRTRQNPYAAYVLQQNPWQYYGRNILGPPEELVEKGVMEPGSKLGNAFGFRTKTPSGAAQMKEYQRRLNMMEP